MKLELLHKIFLAALLAASANLVFLMAHGGSLSTGFLHAQNGYKPLLILNGAFLLTVLAGTPRKLAAGKSDGFLLGALVALAAAMMAFSFSVNPLYDEWNYRGYSSTHDSLSGLAHLFASSQIGVWYRPIGFVSLWADYALFHQHVWAYHFQNVLLHSANCFLVYLLARRLELSESAARWSGVLFLTAAITYEPMMWPSARFDLWAMLFTLAALLAAIRFLTGADRMALALALVCYACAVASKESGYAFPVLLVVVAAAWPFAQVPSDKKRRLIELAVGVILVTGVMLVIREAVLGGTGGYPGTSTIPSPHLSFSLATLRILLTRAMPWSMLAVNFSYRTPLFLIGAFAVVLALAGLAGASTARRDWLPAACVFAAAVPVAPIVSWLDFHAQHVRYLYMPAAFVMMFIAAALVNARRGELFLLGFATLNLACGFHNASVYRETYIDSRELAGQIQQDLNGPHRNGETPQVEIVGMPEEYNGVLFSRFELEFRLEELAPGVKIDFQEKGACSAPLCYAWDAEQSSLRRID